VSTDRSGNIHHAAGSPAGGQFAPKGNSEPDTGLEGPAAKREVNGTIRYLQWTGVREDTLTELRCEAADIARVLDTMPLDTVRTLGDRPGDNDVVFEILNSAGLAHHDGPYDVDIDLADLEKYIEARERAGEEQPVRTSIIQDLDQVLDALTDVNVRLQELEARKAQLVRVLVAETALKHVPGGKLIALLGEESAPFGPLVVVRDKQWRPIELTPEAQRTFDELRHEYGIQGTFEVPAAHM